MQGARLPVCGHPWPPDSRGDAGAPRIPQAKRSASRAAGAPRASPLSLLPHHPHLDILEGILLSDDGLRRRRLGKHERGYRKDEEQTEQMPESHRHSPFREGRMWAKPVGRARCRSDLASHVYLAVRPETSRSIRGVSDQWRPVAF